MRKALKWLDENGERWLLLFLYSFIVLVIATEVFRRFALLYSSVWGEETARYAFIYLVWIGAAVAVRDRAHIRIDVITHALPPRGAALVYLFGDLLTVALACFAIYWSLDPVLVSWKYGNVTDGLRIIRVWFLMAVPFGFTVMLVRLAQSIHRDIADLIGGRPHFAGRKLFD
ncbi:TRAP transporter small permease [Kaustia mangrovi]|uniref:TRAP transporter small permease protein n=1 Tax=Kaustia mangrovi TaxID=2593653 RepID=A0A7S8C5R1_9HYPH|nr:TRAP transporter small permease [Kaustia mangrovi]QPC43699.1 TRAP transporter small permease [Kaustia mangrovi]